MKEFSIESNLFETEFFVDRSQYNKYFVMSIEQ